MLKTHTWYQSLGLFVNTWCKIVLKIEFFAVFSGDSTSPSENATNSGIQFVYSTSWSCRMQKFDLCCWKWTRNITINYFGIIKLVLDGVMVVLIHLQWLISKLHDYMCSYVLEILIWMFMFLWVLDRS